MSALISLCFFSTNTLAQSVSNGSAQAVSDSLNIPLRDSSVRLFAVPIVFFSNDTRWGFGAAGILTFRGYPLRSSITFSTTYTQRRQFSILFPYQWYSPEGYWRAYGQIGWYRYSYQFFGIGNSFPNDYKETYTAKYPHLRVTMVHRLGRQMLAGLRYSMDVYRISAPTTDGQIARDLVTGADGGFSSGVGPVLLFDSRDHSFFPRHGWLAEASLIEEHRLTGSDFHYLKFALEGARYFSLGRKTVLVGHGLAVFTTGEAPFYLLPTLGGNRRLRGYPDGKYRDRHLLLGQSELRFPLIWRFQGVVFGGAGGVFGTTGERIRWHSNYGGGLRIEFDRKQQLHLRVDYGVGQGEGNSGFYVTVGEAF